MKFDDWWAQVIMSAKYEHLEAITKSISREAYAMGMQACPRLIDDQAMVRALAHCENAAGQSGDDALTLRLRCYKIGLNDKILSTVLDQYEIEQTKLNLENDPEMVEYLRLQEKFKGIDK